MTTKGWGTDGEGIEGEGRAGGKCPENEGASSNVMGPGDGTGRSARHGIAIESF